MRSILYVGNNLKSTTPTTLRLLSEKLHEQGHTVYTTSSVPNKAIRLLDMLNSIRKYKKTIDIVLIDTYSTSNFYYAFFCARLCQKLNIPYIPILHGGNLPSRIKRSPIKSNAIFNKAKAMVSPSDYLGLAFAKAYPSTPMHIIHNAIELDKYPVIAKTWDAPRLLWVRRLSSIYNPEMAVRVLATIQKTHPEATLTMVGPDSDGSLLTCKALASDLGVTVHFKGMLSKNAWIQLSKEHNIFINTTNFDNTPVSVVEAMALGFPIVSTDVGGLPYMMQHDENALLVPPNDHEAMTAMIESIILDSALRARLSKAAIETAQKYDWSYIGNQWNSILNSI